VIEYDKHKFKEAVQILAPGTGQAALDAIADTIEEANDNCCGCGWPAEMAEILRSGAGKAPDARTDNS
jgi:hypothetical protein